MEYQESIEISGWCVKELLSILRASREIGPLLPLVTLPEKVEATVFYSVT